jgi:hypothetical protein
MRVTIGATRLAPLTRTRSAIRRLTEVSPTLRNERVHRRDHDVLLLVGSRYVTGVVLPVASGAAQSSFRCGVKCAKSGIAGRRYEDHATGGRDRAATLSRHSRDRDSNSS